MDKKGIMVVLLGIISLANGLAAEFTRVKASDVNVGFSGRCSYPSSPALVLSLTSAATLLIGNLIINFSTGCFCCKTKSHNSSNRPKALCFYIVFLVTFIIAIGLLLTGARLNERHDDAGVRNGAYYCYVVKPGVFAAGAILGYLSSLFGIFYYQTLNSKEKDAQFPNEGGIPMARPQFPVQNPAFLHGHDDHKKSQLG